ncbi:MAG: hypothetical protein LBG47_10345 [Prevotellaceae bacterium]|jgi:hypothetical protein|nr:hypothetical protein [Prevotellaceae bacterium]
MTGVPVFIVGLLLRMMLAKVAKISNLQRREMEKDALSSPARFRHFFAEETKSRSRSPCPRMRYPENIFYPQKFFVPLRHRSAAYRLYTIRFT